MRDIAATVRFLTGIAMTISPAFFKMEAAELVIIIGIATLLFHSVAENKS